MKLICSELQKLLPGLNKDPQTLRDDLTMIGHFTNFYEEIEGEIVFDLDIKVNRGDCLGYYGLARDLSVYYQLPLQLSQSSINHIDAAKLLPIEINTPDVQRLQAIRLSHIKNLNSPEWLKKVLRLHNINSINTLVDLTNYAMLFWGIPNHAFDINKTTSQLIWKNIEKPTKFTTLDGTLLLLEKPTLVITNPSQVLSLSFIGGQNSGIGEDTSETIIEMAVYNPARVRSDWRTLRTVTEAAIRLEKELDPETIPQAFAHLISLIVAETGAEISSALFDYQAHLTLPQPISLDFDKPSLVSGISIPHDFVTDCLSRLGCHIDKHQITPPSIRKDITAEEDLVEEAVRFWGYQKIPISQPLPPVNYPDITPPILKLIEDLKDKLATLGYDEVLTWPLVRLPLNEHAIRTQNSINEEYPYLRQSIRQSLAIQIDQYQRLKLFDIQVFEIGKVFATDQSQTPTEKYSLCLYHFDPSKLEKDLHALGLSAAIQDNYAEIILDDLPKPEQYHPQAISSTAFELNSQLITLDANFEFGQEQDKTKLLNNYAQKIGKHLWQITISDIYHNPQTNRYRYTFRVTYFNLDDKTAKSLHSQTFGLQS